MADTKTSDLTAIPALAADDVIPIVDATDTTTKKVAISELDGRYIMESDVVAKGDLFVATANDAVGVLTVGTNGHVLTADSTASTGVKWAAASGGGNSGVLDAMNSTQQVDTTTTETTVATLAVPAGAVADADTRLVGEATGALLNNGGTYNHIYRLKIDGTTVMTMTKSQGSSGNLLAWKMRWVIDCPSEAVQNIGYDAVWAALASSSGVAAGSTTGSAAAGFAETTVDMSDAHNITLTVEMSNSSSSVQERIYAVTLVKYAPLA